MKDPNAVDVAAVGRINAVPRILEVVCRTTGMGFSAVARVTEDRWVACAVRDQIATGPDSLRVLLHLYNRTIRGGCFPSWSDRARTLRPETAPTGSCGEARGSVQSIIEARELCISRSGFSCNLQERRQMNTVVAAQRVALCKIAGISA